MPVSFHINLVKISTMIQTTRDTRVTDRRRYFRPTALKEYSIQLYFLMWSGFLINNHFKMLIVKLTYFRYPKTQTLSLFSFQRYTRFVFNLLIQAQIQGGKNFLIDFAKGEGIQFARIFFILVTSELLRL